MTPDNQSDPTCLYFIFNDLSKRPPLPRPRLASDGTTRDPSTLVYFGQTRPYLGTTLS